MKQPIERLIISFCDGPDKPPVSTAVLSFPDTLRIPFESLQKELVEWLLVLQLKYETVEKGKES